MDWHLRFGLALVLSLLSAPLAAQQQPAAPAAPADGWNGERAMELIRRAQANRAAARADTGLLSYRADARAYVYFYLDREDTGERNLVKTDQIALDVFWREPDFTKQRIVGWRDRKSLPTNINYHIDHLAIVQENFGDEIRIGDGDEVRNVLHPAAPDTEEFYEYRLTDSLTLRLPGASEPVRVYELQVRPRDLSRPAFLGSVFVERRAGDLVRMDFTFTPSAYVDPRLDYINISLDNGLWKGRFWLPNEQRLEIRREIRGLDLPAGSVIRGTMRVGNYRFNEELPLALFDGRPVVLAPREEREAFPFEREIDAELREEGIGPEAELEEIRRQAREIAPDRVLSGLGGVRPWIPGASEVFRYNRAEGAAVSLGLSFEPRPRLEMGVRAGWAFGPGHPLGEVSIGGEPGPFGWELSAYGNRPRDFGVGPAASGTANTLSALFAARDYLDPFYATGVELRVRRRLSPAWTLSAAAGAEIQESARNEADFSVFGTASDFRAVRRIQRGVMSTLLFRLARDAPVEQERWWSADATARIGRLSSDMSLDATGTGERGVFLRPEARLGWGRQWSVGGARLEVGAAGGAVFGKPPVQSLFLLGGRGTVPGYPFRAFGGDRYALTEAIGSFDLAPPWLRGRLLVAAGWADASGSRETALRLRGAPPTGGIRASLGAGIGILDIFHVDLARGLDDYGRWELIVEANPSFWDFL